MALLELLMGTVDETFARIALHVVVELKFLGRGSLAQGLDFAVELQARVGLEEVFAHDVAGGEEVVVIFERLKRCLDRKSVV